NNPLKYNDPDGHWPRWVVPVVVGVVVIGAGAFLIAQLPRMHSTGDGATECQGALAECFKSREVRDFEPNEQIDEGEFSDMLTAVYDDIESQPRSSWDPARSMYDTPFYTGNPTNGPAI